MADRIRIAEALQREPGPEEIMIRGWVRTKREGKGVAFCEVNDGSCMSNLQVVFDLGGGDGSDAAGIARTELDRLGTGASAEIRGVLVESPGKNQTVELAGRSLRVIGEAPADYPLQKKRHSFEYLREIAHLRPRTNTFGAVARVRHALSMSIHRFFQDNGFLYVHTPLITASDAEGAGALFQVTTLDADRADLERVEGRIDWSRDFFGKKAYLTVSGQLSVENYACALDRVYTFGPTFRAENSNTTRHLAEFWMIEPEMAFCELAENIDVAERFITTVLRDVLAQCEEDMGFFDLRIQKGLIEDLQRVVDKPFERISYTEAVDLLQKSGRKFEFEPAWGRELQSEHEKYIAEEIFKGPVAVTDYPREIKAFYMRLNDDGKTVRAVDLIVPRLGEIIGGSEREFREDVLRSRIADAGLNAEDYWWYLDLRRFGTVPHSGFGLGFERMVQYVTGMQNIRDVIPFPRAPRLLEF